MGDIDRLSRPKKRLARCIAGLFYGKITNDRSKISIANRFNTADVKDITQNVRSSRSSLLDLLDRQMTIQNSAMRVRIAFFPKTRYKLRFFTCYLLSDRFNFSDRHSLGTISPIRGKFGTGAHPGSTRSTWFSPSVGADNSCRGDKWQGFCLCLSF